MTSEEILTIFKKTGGYITGDHIILTSGKHTDSYLNKDTIYPHTQEISRICQEIAGQLKDKNIEVVAAPALGGIILSQWTAYHLSLITRREVLGVYTEKTSDRDQIFTRGYDKLVKGKRVLVVEDVTTTGGSVRKVINSVKNAGGKIAGVCVLVNRDPDNINAKTFDAPFYSLAFVKMQTWDETDCPLCKRGIPVNTTVGKGKEKLFTGRK